MACNRELLVLLSLHHIADSTHDLWRRRLRPIRYMQHFQWIDMILPDTGTPCNEPAVAGPRACLMTFLRNGRYYCRALRAEMHYNGCGHVLPRLPAELNYHVCRLGAPRGIDDRSLLVWWTQENISNGFFFLYRRTPISIKFSRHITVGTTRFTIIHLCDLHNVDSAVLCLAYPWRRLQKLCVSLPALDHHALAMRQVAIHA